MTWLRATAATLCLLALPAAALAGAAKPKRGYYIDPKWQVYVVVGASRTSLTSIQASCLTKDAAGKLQNGGQFNIPKSKHPKISSAGKFSFKGGVKLSPTAKTTAQVTITGTFANGKLKGAVKFTDAGTTCAPYSYTGAYYGVNPGG